MSNSSDAGAVPFAQWQPISTAPKDGTTIEVRGVMLVHQMPGAKFSMMPKDWRPDTPQTEWRLTEWRAATTNAGENAEITQAREASEPPTFPHDQI